MKEEERKKNQRLAEKRWHNANLKKICFSFNKETDKDILDWLDNQPKKADAIRNVIRQSMKK